MDLISIITDDWGRAFGFVGMIIGALSFINTVLIKRKQIKEIGAAKEIAIFNSDMPRAAIIEKPNESGVGLLFLRLENQEELTNYLNKNQSCKVITAEYGGCGIYNKVEVLKRID